MSIRRNNPKRDSNESYVREILAAHGVMTFPMSQRGIPDLLCIAQPDWRIPMFMVECKSKYGELTKDQADFFDTIKAYDAPVSVVRDGETFMNTILEKYRYGR